MSYGNLLRKTIAESGFNSTEIIRACNSRGRKIDKAYLSRLLNDKVPPPAEELSRMLADICGIDERKLVLEGYIEKAPKEIKEAFLSIKFMASMMGLLMFENKVDKEVLEQLQQKLEEEPLSDFIISLIDEKSDKMDFIQNGVKMWSSKDNFKFTLQEPLALTINDNGMFPKIMKNSKVNLKIQKDYNDWDILAVKIKGKDEIIARFALIDKDKITLKPLNNDFETQELSFNDLTILGKVTQTITNI